MHLHVIGCGIALPKVMERIWVTTQVLCLFCAADSILRRARIRGCHAVSNVAIIRSVSWGGSRGARGSLRSLHPLGR